MNPSEILKVRTGQHECYDRVVVDVDGPPAGYHAEYVSQVFSDPKGDVVTVPGGARIQFTVRHPDNHNTPTIGHQVASTAGFRTLRSVVFAGSFEGVTTYGVGTRARLPFRVFTLPKTSTTPGRIVLDVAHRW